MVSKLIKLNLAKNITNNLLKTNKRILLSNNTRWIKQYTTKENKDTKVLSKSIEDNSNNVIMSNEMEKQMLLQQKMMNDKDIESITEEELDAMYKELFPSEKLKSTKQENEDSLKQMIQELGLDKEERWSIEKVNEKLNLLAQIKNKKNISLVLIHELLYLFSQQKNEEASLLTLDLMEQKGIKINEKTYTCIMDLYSNKEDLENCIKYFKKIKEECLEPYDRTYFVLVKMYAKLGRVDDAFDVYQIMKSKGYNITKHIMINLIVSCVNAGEYERAWKTFDHMRLNLYQPDVVSYSYMINVCAKQNMVEKAFNLFELMKEEGIEPNLVALNNLILACSTNKEYYNEALKLLDQIKEKGLQTNVHTYIGLLMNARRSKQLDYARKLFSKILQLNLNPREIQMPLSLLLFTYSTYYSKFKRENQFIKENKILSTEEVIDLLNNKLPKDSKHAVLEVENLMDWYMNYYIIDNNNEYISKLITSFLAVQTNYGNYERAMEIFNSYKDKDKNLYIINQILNLCFELKKKEKCIELYQIIDKILKPLEPKSTLSFIEKKEYMKQNNINEQLLLNIYRTLINGFSNLNELELSIHILTSASKDASIGKQLKLSQFKQLYNNLHRFDRIDLKPIVLDSIPSLKEKNIERSKYRLNKKWQRNNGDLEVSKANRKLVKELAEARLLE
ncbi:TPR-like protein [Neoconidiobolus thromboides FSU 785]|nr:TPR-like protein [Neoconidiobolus thromboides FSU 785]